MIKPEVKTAILFSYLNAENEIPRALDFWYPHVDYIIAGDGRYKTPLSPKMAEMELNDFSTDGSEHLLKTRYADKIHHISFHGTQMEKRQKMLDLAGELGVQMAITIDSDEFVFPGADDWNLFYKQLEAMYEAFPEQRLFLMRMYIPDFKTWQPQFNEVPPNKWTTYTRVHRNPGEMKYVLNHYCWTDKKVTQQTLFKYMFEESASLSGDLRHPDFNKHLLRSDIILDGIRLTTDRTLRDIQGLDFGNHWTWQQMHWENFANLIEAHWHYWGNKCQYEYLKDTYPDIDYYFDERGMLIPYSKDKDGKYIILKPNVPPEIDEKIDQQIAFDKMKLAEYIKAQKQAEFIKSQSGMPPTTDQN